MQLLIILLLVLINGVLAMSEIAVVSARRANLQARAEAGSEGAAAALSLSEAPNRFLATVQIGITLVGVLAGAFGGATVGRQFGAWLAGQLPVLAPVSQTLGIGAVVLLTTYLSLVLGELVPKRIGLEYAEAVAAAIARPMQQVAALFAPVVWLLSTSTNLVLRTLGIQPGDGAPITDAEVISMIQEGTTAGVFDLEEVRMVRGVLRLDNRRVASIMTPRPDINWLDITDDLESVKEQIISHPHSFFPIAEESIDNVLGIIKAKDLLTPLVRGEPIDLRAMLRPPLYIPGVAAIASALQMFKVSGAALALVIDEHGGIDGIITVNDVIEEIVGDIDAEDPKAVQRADGSWLLDGTLALENLGDLLPGKFAPPDEETGSYDTLAGFIMARLGRIPSIADTFTYAGWRFEVVDMDGARIDRVLVSPVEKGADDAAFPA